MHSRSISGYKILDQIGTGAASILFAVQDPRTKQVWALKHVIKHTPKDERFLKQVEAEYEVGSKLDHPCIRGVEKLIKHRRGFRVHAISILMELVDAGGLDEAMPRTHQELVRIFLNIARGLAHMHEKGFVHADIKPTNILVSDESSVKIIDLGQSCPTGTVKERVQGTPGYIAPEQAHREEITPKTDVYNFGATMYWVLTKTTIPTALPASSTGKLSASAIETDRIKPPVPVEQRNDSVHPGLSSLILDCVKVEPRDRPMSMRLVADRLDDLISSFGAPLEIHVPASADLVGKAR